MNLTDIQEKRAIFLNGQQHRWQYEILQHYPESIAHFPQDWILYLKGMTDHDQWQFDIGKMPGENCPRDLQQLLQDIDSMSEVPSLGINVGTSRPLTGVTPKKAHEINQLLSWLQVNKPQTLIDIGGGVGHLSAILNHELGIKTICLEANHEFIKLGARHRRKLHGRGEITHRHIEVPSWESINQAESKLDVDDVWPEGVASLGLHTCGPLALSHFAMGKRRQSKIINIACCYFRLNPKIHTNLAGAFQLSWTGHALTLATRGHTGFSLDHFMMKKRVKFYRYAFELLLGRVLAQKDFTSIGESKTKKYLVPFADFALEKLAQILPGHGLTRSVLNDFYENEKLQIEVSQMFAANLIRWRYGRILEVHLLVDRVLYLKKMGAEVNWGSIFNQEISPRNIMIIATPNS